MVINGVAITKYPAKVFVVGFGNSNEEYFYIPPFLRARGNTECGYRELHVLDFDRSGKTASHLQNG